ncbi:MAG: NAD(P)-dependent glycerol-3-phosphate dehydrogenase [Calditrichaeota bacterium]|nr:MAG: NAD(P)-dependent glycerol-3-phosphate dehydrogenase [Calditrichota bacterium]
MQIAILGAGSWGIALANHCHSIGHFVTLWEFDSAAAQELQLTRMRESVLKGISLQPDIAVTSDLGFAVVRADVILTVTPSHVVRDVLRQLNTISLRESAVLVNCAKGIEIDTLSRISQIVKEELTAQHIKGYVVLSGPSHAEEVSRNIPTAIVAASEDDILARYIQQALSSIWLRIYRSCDVIGVELGGSLKNVIAIAAGVCDGAGFGDNTKAALQPRGLAEIARLGQKLGADPLTFSGLSGMGDLIVTCMSRHSRNRYVGEQIGQGKTLSEILDNMIMVAEGVLTSKAAVALAEKFSVELPICTEVYRLLYENKNTREALTDLLTREAKPEIWF